MARVIDMQAIKRGDALVRDALRMNPHVLDRLTEATVMAICTESKNDSILISVRIPKKLLKELDTMTRERAYIEQKRVTRNNLIVHLIETAVQGVKPHD